MTEQLCITESDLRLILDVVDPDRCGEDGEHVPDSMLRDLSRLIACDAATFQVMDPYRQEISIQDTDDDGELDDDVLALWWPAFWEGCAYPMLTGDYATIMRSSNHEPGPRWQAYAEAAQQTIAHHVIVSLPPSGATDRRLLLWRDGGSGFSDRDVQLLQLLRPHLAEVYDRHQHARIGEPALTHRQWEILRLVSDGCTNGQIARRLALSEATVRKHLENTYARLGVTNRTAAVGRARRYLRAS